MTTAQSSSRDAERAAVTVLATARDLIAEARSNCTFAWVRGALEELEDEIEEARSDINRWASNP